ncbi:MAG: hypothetical protein JW724_05895 [Candidatus Altiarchaeota archaeon]|nr:hypothetical protein [Candidatus Altiarchaeota archaeon]
MIAALALAFLMAGNVHATTYCKAGTKTYEPGVYTFSGVNWICRADGTWYKVQTQAKKCTSEGKTYSPGTHGFASGVWICQTNGKWTKAQNQPSTWTCYGTYTCYRKTRNGVSTTYATKGGKTWYYYNGKWYEDTKLTTQSSTLNNIKVTACFKTARDGNESNERIYKLYQLGSIDGYSMLGTTPKCVTYTKTGTYYIWIGIPKQEGCYIGLSVGTKYAMVVYTSCSVTRESANNYRIDF